MRTKLHRRLQRGWLPYYDGRGKPCAASYKMPRKLKKVWRGMVEANLRLMRFNPRIKWRLWWKPRVGWTVAVVARKDRGICRG